MAKTAKKAATKPKDTKNTKGFEETLWDTANSCQWPSILTHVRVQRENLSKKSAAPSFAAAAQIPRLLSELNEKVLARYTPCHQMHDDDLIEAIAVVHVEFILVHPFREGNGRLSRLLADTMAAQAGYDPLDYALWDDNKKEYFLAIHAGMECNYAPMMEWVERAFNVG